MMKLQLIVSTLAMTILLSTGIAFAADQDRDQLQAQDRNQVYGSQLMTPEERAEHRTRMRAARTPQEREQIRMQQHKRMQERARARGLTLPDEPPMRGGGMGRGRGIGPGDQVYGSQLMTPEERAEHRDRMRAARTPQERERIRMQQHKRMQERAKARGLTLPDEPPMRGGGMGRGRGMDSWDDRWR